MSGFFDKIFDFNNDGKMNMFEETTQFAAFASIMDDTEETDNTDNTDNTADLTAFEESSEEVDLSLLDEVQQSELEEAGLDEFDLELMDDCERREAIEEAGLDPDDYF